MPFRFRRPTGGKSGKYTRHTPASKSSQIASKSITKARKALERPSKGLQSSQWPKMDIEESADELSAKIAEYKSQLDTVKAALADDPENEQLQNLLRDLTEVIGLTSDLLNYKTQSQDIFDDADEEAPAQESQADAPKADETGALIGGLCVVLYNERKRYGKVTELRGNEPDDMVVIELLGSGEKCGLALKDLQLLQGPPVEACPNGTLVQALYLEEGRWYDAIVNRATEDGFVITYKDYNTSERVTRDRVRLKIQTVKEHKEVVTPAGYKIPENLIVKQNDNEKERMRKRKLVQTLKKRQRAEKMEAEARERANSWRNFQNKAGAKNKSGYMTGKREGSIFSSESTSTLTAQAPSFLPRRKFDYNEHNK